MNKSIGIKEVLSGGEKYNSVLFRLHFKASDDYRTGFMARHNAAIPVRRNRTKRVIRETWKRYFKKGNYIFILKPAAMNASAEKIKKELERIAGLIGCEKF